MHAVQRFDRSSSVTSADINIPPPTAIYGTQHAAKFNRTAPDEVLIFLALFRIAQKNVDLVLTFNVPVTAQDGGALAEDAVNKAKEDFEAAVLSLNIVDVGLFV